MNTRNKSLDALRGIAVLLVIGFHMPYFPLLGRIGWCGVDLFFVLSGYLISGLLFREYVETGTLKIGRFLLRRGLKIWPSLYVFLAVMVPFLFYIPSTSRWISLASSAFFYSNYLSPMKLLGHTWSLAVEEHFYCTLPLLLLVLIRWERLHWIPGICGLLFVSCLSLRILFPVNAWCGTQFRIDSLFAGVSLAYLREFRPNSFAFIGRVHNLPFAAILISAVLLKKPQVQTFGFCCLAVGFSIILACAVDRSPRAIPVRFAWETLARIGAYSYCIYLWQQPFSAAYNYHPSLFQFVTVVSFTVSFAVMMAKVVEMPALRLRDRFFPAPSKMLPSTLL